jgi:glycosyltransferase involved in cell wall biosynthesis
VTAGGPTASRPLVSIGVPVHNGGPFLRSTLDSLLAQDYAPLELIVSDNASTDATQAICLEYAGRDDRIRYERNAENLGAVWNFNRVARLASGPYFMWAGAHDLWDPGYVSRCVQLLEAEPGLVVAYAHARQIDEDGATLQERMADEADTRGLAPLARYRVVTWHVRVCNVVHGVMRRSLLASTPLFENLWCPDHLLIAELSLLGPFGQLEDVLFLRRRNRPPEDAGQFQRRVAGQLDPASARARGQASRQHLYRELRDAHLRLLRRHRLPLPARLYAEASTLAAFCCRFQVPCTDWPWLDRLLDFSLHRLKLRRLFEPRA